MISGWHRALISGLSLAAVVTLVYRPGAVSAQQEVKAPGSQTPGALCRASPDPRPIITCCGAEASSILPRRINFPSIATRSTSMEAENSPPGRWTA